ncbi:uncharacterized protein LOC120254923 isoform X2 [Dioscorea cayenensis subsp. rotundata]|uniref:Uncharacterized protein LOC120254923 isoform X2 n=1 Tax=Dioscorea cayennensis subsp. rotundata TaxID=55577 RepID=A0AB40AV18_DIOCR|nr:uncharacterized protein LOC120254923 isoform X2 [Dioscorea cayenensis subsp. rotundata]
MKKADWANIKRIRRRWKLLKQEYQLCLKDAISKRLEEVYKRLEFIDAYSAEARPASILAVRLKRNTGTCSEEIRKGLGETKAVGEEVEAIREVDHLMASVIGIRIHLLQGQVSCGWRLRERLTHIQEYFRIIRRCSSNILEQSPWFHLHSCPYKDILKFIAIIYTRVITKISLFTMLMFQDGRQDYTNLPFYFNVK